MDHSGCGKYKDNMVTWSRDAKEHGHVTGAHRHCQLEGCLGRRVGVSWGDQITWPCSNGLETYKESEQIIL